jgi:hypothetical protein
MPADAEIKIVETGDDRYTPTFTDSAGTGGVNDTGFRKVGKVARTFKFFNNREVVPGTGIADDPSGSAALTPIALLILAVLITTVIIRRKLSTR